MMKIKIYQIDSEKDKDRLMFCDSYELEHITGSATPDRKIYKEVFGGEVNCNNLEDVFTYFNVGNKPCNMHSLSVEEQIC